MNLEITLGTFLTLISISSLYVYMIGGNIKDVPELGLNVQSRTNKLNFFSSQNNIHIEYNENVRKLNKPFSNKRNNRLVKVLVVGDSFGRDFANILLNSSFKDSIEISYTDLHIETEKDLKTRIKTSDFIFYASAIPPSKERVINMKLNISKLWIVGIKDFGNSNGLHYNRKIHDYKAYTTFMKKDILKLNQLSKSEWGVRYIDLIQMIKDNRGKVPVFTPEGKFISQDTYHLTEFGAVYFAQLLEHKLAKILNLD